MMMQSVQGPTLSSRNRSAGMTIIEILITMLVISVGLLGVAGLHSLSLRNNYDALMRSHASALAADIADRMRTNREAALANAYEIDFDSTPGTIDEDSTIAEIDEYEWLTALAATLPQGRGRVELDDNLVIITIRWGERASAIQEEAQTIEFVTRTEI
jgi:type IV pilus assembly protein PilV